MFCYVFVLLSRLRMKKVGGDFTELLPADSLLVITIALAPKKVLPSTLLFPLPFILLFLNLILFIAYSCNILIDNVQDGLHNPLHRHGRIELKSNNRAFLTSSMRMRKPYALFLLILQFSL